MKKQWWARAVAAAMVAIGLMARHVQAASYSLSAFEPSGYTVQTNAGTAGSRVLTMVAVVAAILTLVYMIWGAIQIITAGGDKSKIEAARNKIIMAAVGLLVVAATWALWRLVVTVSLGSPDEIKTPSLVDSNNTDKK